MNSATFTVTRVRNGWLIAWPGFRDIHQVESKQRLANLIFDSLGAEEVQFSVRLPLGKRKFLHIRADDWAPGAGMMDNLLDRYEITGVLFDSEASARWLQDWFEKRLMWRQLSQTTA